MNTVRLILISIALLLAAWLLADGARALIRGDYFTPESGPHAGELGPWSQLVGRVGIDPRGTAMKVVHVMLGAAWLAAALSVLWRREAGARFFACCAGATLWYAPFGTILGLVVLFVLFVQRRILPRGNS